MNSTLLSLHLNGREASVNCSALNSSGRFLCALSVSFAFFPVHTVCFAHCTPYCVHVQLVADAFLQWDVMTKKLFSHVLLPLLFIRFSLHERIFYGVWLEYFPWIILGEFNMQVFPIDMHYNKYSSQFLHFSILLGVSLLCWYNMHSLSNRTNLTSSASVQIQLPGSKRSGWRGKVSRKPDLSRLMFASSFPV